MAKGTKNTEEKEVSALSKALDELEKKYGTGTIVGAADKNVLIESISTGSIALDAAIGIGGFPKGRIIDITAPESAGKTTLALHVVGNAQEKGIKCAYIDMEHALDYKYARALGVNTDNLIISQPDYGEQALEIVEKLVKTNQVGVIVVDSTAALVPKAEVETGVGDPKMAGIGRIMSQALRVLVGPINKSNCLVIFINQIRGNPGGMTAELSTGGNALKFYAAVRLDLRRIKNDTDKGVSRTKIKVLKNKVGVPFQTIEIDVVWGEGFGKYGEIVDLAEELGIIKRAGAWYSHNDVKIGQGRDAVIQLLKDNKEFAEELEARVIGLLKENQE
jgi:recombination protein RecA